MGLVPVIIKNNKNDNSDIFSGLSSLIPPPELMQAMGTFLPRIMKKSVKLDKTMIPRDSVLKHLYEDEEDENNSEESGKDYVRMTQHQIKTPFGEVHIKSMSKTFVNK
jgi:hypothetical protein